MRLTRDVREAPAGRVADGAAREELGARRQTDRPDGVGELHRLAEREDGDVEARHERHVA